MTLQSIIQLPRHSQALLKKGRERNVREKIRLDIRLELFNTTYNRLLVIVVQSALRDNTNSPLLRKILKHSSA